MPLFGVFLHYMEQNCVSSEQGKDAMESAKARLRAGHSVGIFPEGLVSPQEGGCHPPHTGAARLAVSTGATVIPIGIYLRRERSIYIQLKLSGKNTRGILVFARTLWDDHRRANVVYWRQRR